MLSFHTAARPQEKLKVFFLMLVFYIVIYEYEQLLYHKKNQTNSEIRLLRKSDLNFE